MSQSWPSDAPEFDPLVVESTDSGRRPEHDDRPRSSRGMVPVLVAAVVGAVGLVIVVVGWSSEQAIGPPATTPATTPMELLTPVVTARPFGSTVIDVGDDTPTMPSNQDIDGWIDWSLPEPATVAGFGSLRAPTEVAAVTADGVLHRIELPSGRVRSRPVPDANARAQIALAADAVAVPQLGDVTIVADDGFLSSFGESTNEVPRVVALGESGRFLVLGGRAAPGDPEQLWLLEADGSVADTPAAAFAEADAWNRQFLPTGELLVHRDGEVAAIAVDGTVRRIDDGEVAVTGRHHYAVRQCSERCKYVVVDASTGERAPAELRALDDYRFSDTSAWLSPDGRFLQLVDWQRRQPLAQLISVATGSVVNSWPVDTIRAPGAWGTDSLGYFAATNGALVYYPVDGWATVVEGLGPVRSVATRPLD